MKTVPSFFLYFVLLCGATVLTAQAPQWLWAVGAGGTGGDAGESIEIDSQGNQYVTGYFSDTVTFGSQTLSSNGDLDIFVAKLDPSGNWLWAAQAGGTDRDCGFDISLDSAGNAYVVGYFKCAATFGSHTLTANGYWSSDIFVAKLDPNGNWIWAVNAGGTEYDVGFGIALDGAGNAWVTGYFGGTATFGNVTLTTNGYYDIFVAKLDSSGNWLWAVKAGGTESDEGTNIIVDGMGNAWVTGMFKETTTFGSHTLTASGQFDSFVAKLDSSGNWLWAVKAGGTESDEGNGIAVDGVGNAYVTGYFGDTTTFGSQTLTSSGSDDIFVAKLDSSGNWIWAVQAGGISIDRGYDIVVDGEGNAWVTGHFYGTATFGSHTLTASGGAYDGDMFAAKLDPSGNWIWAAQAGGISNQGGNGIVVDGAGNTYVTGYFGGTTNFGSQTVTSSGGNDIFVAKLGNVTSIEDVLAPEAVARLHDAWPNPLNRGACALIKADITERSKGILSIFNLRGQSVARYELGPGTHQISLSGEKLPAGVYLYSLQCGAFRETKKLVLLK